MKGANYIHIFLTIKLKLIVRERILSNISFFNVMNFRCLLSIGLTA